MAKKQDINEKKRSLTKEQARAIGENLNSPVTKEGREKERELQRRVQEMFGGTELQGTPTRKKSGTKKK